MSQKRKVPGWANRQRAADLAWVMENAHIFWPAAQEQFRSVGRGAIVVDTTQRPTGEGHPFTYMTDAQLREDRFTDASRLIAQYDPSNEIVIIMIKRLLHVSSYRIAVVPRVEPEAPPTNGA